ncbi:fatty-acid amide hydrolase 2 [Pseudomyrmex gracilis]|uniref:fatty-acid amide hydrolase 2 n=1 Tax=Pseudomyrmex gracilis TaxID=219809 RepID=UPI0009957E9F|nr:fatty-acid amide hydrolase 2 [Pseudomyrmex gracilis]XP_020280790.1 fatty-acid amide hydrolase 2 [Pseudomyrmex gracilis]XP_020280791.1 fatty-acid amide hydrolase 2 [Pseudomyrmex gracilis]
MCSSIRNKEPSESEDLIQHTKQICCTFLRFVIIQLHVLFDCIVDFIFGLYYDKKANKVPPVEQKLLLESAVSLAEKIRTKQVTSEEVVGAFIARCKEVNCLINAIVVERYEPALEDAKKVDLMIQQGIDQEKIKNEKPFLGVPFTTKESNRAEGLIHSLGLLCRRNHCCEDDAATVRLLKEAGAILIAKTNVPELNLWTESRNHLFGQTNNPYNTTRTVGGSSGGEGALMAASGTPLSLASDIGGSTRMPAFFNGCFGHKPSEGLISVYGIGLRDKHFLDTMVAAGPICRHAEDIAPVLKVLIDKNPKFQLDDRLKNLPMYKNGPRLRFDESVNVKDLKVFYQESSGDLRASKVTKTMRTTIRKAVKHLEKLTGSATKIKIPGSEYSFKLWRYWMTRENVNFRENITGGKYSTSAIRELANLLTGNSQLTAAAVFKLADEDFFPEVNAEWAKSVTAKAKLFLAETLGDNGVLLYTSAPFPASYHYSAFLRPYNFGYWCFFNVLRFPSLQVPMGLDKQGLPVGIQVIAAPYNDHLCLAVGRELEKEFGGWVQP